MGRYYMYIGGAWRRVLEIERWEVLNYGGDGVVLLGRARNLVLWEDGNFAADSGPCPRRICKFGGGGSTRGYYVFGGATNRLVYVILGAALRRLIYHGRVVQNGSGGR